MEKIYILHGDFWPQEYSDYVSVFFVSEDKDAVEKKRKELKKKYPEASLSIDEIPLNKDCNIFLGGYGE